MFEYKLRGRGPVLALIGLCLSAATAHAAEWTSWRGGDYNGVSTDTDLISSWSPEGENLVWKADFIGRSTPVVVDGRVCANGRVGDGIDRQAIVACFDANDGHKLWEHRFNVYNTTVPFNRVGWASLVADPATGRIYAHGVAGQLTAYEPDGRIVWSRFLTEELGHLSGYGGRTQTPLIEGDQLILSFVSSGWGAHGAPRHRYFSFDKATGDVLWISTPGGMPADMNTQSAPVVADIQGRRVLVSGNADGWIYALDAYTGEKIWSFHLSLRGLNSSVLVEGNRVFASHSEENVDEPIMGRVVAIDATGTGDVTATHEIWRIDAMSAGFPSPTYYDGTLYVVDNSANLYGIDASNGTIRWEYSLGTVGKGSPVVADGKLYVTEVNGRFHILKPGKDGATSLDVDELTVPGGRYAEIYGSPAMAYGRIYFTTEGGLYCLGKKGEGLRKTGSPTGGRNMPPGGGDVATVLVAPTEVLMEIGDSQPFRALTFNAKGGKTSSASKAKWSMKGLQGSIDEGGNFIAAGEVAQAGSVVAQVGDLVAEARVRVLPKLPWSEDFERYDVGTVPPTWIGAGKKFEVQEHDGKKVLAKLYRPRGLLRNALYMGPSTMSGYTIQADVRGGAKGRRKTDAALINSGYTMDLMGNHQRIEVRTWPAQERMAQRVPFAWEMDGWYRMKLRVDVSADRALVRGKVWPVGDAEPEAWNITVEDPHPIAGGSPGLSGYSPADILFDNVKVTVND